MAGAEWEATSQDSGLRIWDLGSWICDLELLGMVSLGRAFVSCAVGGWAALDPDPQLPDPRYLTAYGNTPTGAGMMFQVNPDSPAGWE